MFYGSMKMLVRQVLANFESVTKIFIGSIFSNFTSTVFCVRVFFNGSTSLNLILPLLLSKCIPKERSVKVGGKSCRDKKYKKRNRN